MSSTRAMHPPAHPVPQQPLPPVVVIGACGGAGASSLAAAVAVVAAREGPSALVDLDLAGGGLDVVLGIEGAPGARWTDLGAARGDVDPHELVASLPRWRRVPVLSADRRVPTWPYDDVAPDVLGALAARHRLVLDVPRDGLARRDDRVIDGLLASGGPESVDGHGTPGSVVVLVVPLTVSALAGATAVRSALEVRVGSAGIADGLLVVTRSVRHSELRADDVADALEVDVVARSGHDAAARAAIERGEGPRVGRRSGWRRAAAAVLGAADGGAAVPGAAGGAGAHDAARGAGAGAHDAAGGRAPDRWAA